MKRTITEILDQLGTRPLARELGYKPSRVQQWKARANIPSEHIAAVVKASRKLNAPTSADEIAHAIAQNAS